MNQVTHCSHCGGKVTSLSARFCEYCGTALPRPEPATEPQRVEGRPDPQELLAQIKNSRETLELMQKEITGGVASNVMSGGCSIVFGLFFTGVAIFMFVMFSNVAGFPFALFPLLFVAVGIGMTLKFFKKTTDFATAETEAKQAVVLDKRSETRSSDDSSRTTYYVALEFSGGERAEYLVQRRIYGQLAEGDVGVAYVRTDVLLDFKRVRT